jgi:hypothetical protein
MDHLSLESLKEPSHLSPSSSNGLTSRRHTVSHEKVPARTQAAIEKVSEIVNKMGGQVRTHIQDNGGSIPTSDWLLKGGRCDVRCLWI